MRNRKGVALKILTFKSPAAFRNWLEKIMLPRTVFGCAFSKRILAKNRSLTEKPWIKRSAMAGLMAKRRHMMTVPGFRDSRQGDLKADGPRIIPSIPNASLSPEK
jgi:hypothetical protein